MAGNVEHGMTALHVAEEMVKILDKDAPAPHYVIGEPVQKISTLAQRFLPARAWEWVLGKYYG